MEGNGRHIKHIIGCSTLPKYCLLWSRMKLGKLRSIDHFLMRLNLKGKRSIQDQCWIAEEKSRLADGLRRERPFSTNQHVGQVRD